MSIPSKLKIATDLAWGIVQGKPLSGKYHTDRYIEVLRAMYPGIYVHGAQIQSFLQTAVRRDLSAQHPKLAQFKTQADLMTVFGPTVEVAKVRACNGTEWTAWGERKSAVTGLGMRG